MQHHPRSAEIALCPWGGPLTTLMCWNALHRGADWANLPHEILNIVIGKLTVDSYHMRSAVRMRPVCKPWRDALAYFGGPAYLGCDQTTDVQQFCSSLPGISWLYVEINAANIRLTALSSLSLLSQLTFRGNEAADSAVEEAVSMLHHFPLLKVSHFHWRTLQMI